MTEMIRRRQQRMVAELVRNMIRDSEMSLADVAKALGTDAASLNTKISRGTFGFAWFLTLVNTLGGDRVYIGTPFFSMYFSKDVIRCTIKERDK